MKQSEIFISAFTDLENYLREKLSLDRVESFYAIIKKAREKGVSAVREHECLLKSAGDLRNAIVHGRGYSERVIAEPLESFVTEFTCICEKIKSPKKAISIGSRLNNFHSLADKLGDALILMHQKDFSQLICKADDGYTLVTREGIAKWVEVNTQNDIVSLQDITLRDINRHEDYNNWEFMSKNADVYHVKDCFANAKRRIQAVLITEHGRNTEKPLAIITPWDISREEL